MMFVMKLLRRFSGCELALFSQILLAGALFTGCETTYDSAYSDVSPPSATPITTIGTAPTGTPADIERFRVGDSVTVTFGGISDVLTQLPPHEETVKEDGNITLNLIGAVKAAGKTTGELQKEIHDLYVPKYYVRLTVTVKPELRSYTIGGEVKMPGPKFWLPGTTVIKAIQAAGDFTDYASKRNVKLTRADGTVITINCKKAINDRRLDPLVFPGDQINVKRSIL